MSQDDFGRATRIAAHILDALETEEDEDPAVIVAAHAITMADGCHHRHTHGRLSVYAG